MELKPDFSVGLHLWSFLLAFCTLLLVAPDAGLSVPDWSLLARVCVLCQLALGAAARHKAIGSIYHLAASPIVTGVILWVSLRILLHYAQSRELRLASTTLLGITFCQVFPGIAAYMTRISYAAPARVFADAGIGAVS